MKFWDLYMQLSIRFLEDLRIILRCQKSTCISLYIRQLSAVMVVSMKFKFEQKPWMKLLKKVLQLTGHIRKAATIQLKMSRKKFRRSLNGSRILKKTIATVMIQLNICHQLHMTCLIPMSMQ